MTRPILLFSENLNDFAVNDYGNVQIALCLPCEDSIVFNANCGNHSFTSDVR